VVSQGVGNPHRVLGKMVRFYREQAGLSRAEVAGRICKSVPLVQAIELGERSATDQVASDLDAALSAGGALAKLREEMRNGLGYQVFPAWFQEWAQKEAEAATLRYFQPLVVPGLLQTAGYARAIFRTELVTTDEEIDEQVGARMKRQEALTRSSPPMVWVIVDEGAVRRQIGGQPVMSEQLDRIVKAARQPNVVVQVIPASLGAHRGLESGFAIADFADGPSLGFREGAGGGHMVEDSAGLRVLDRIWDTLRGDTLPRAASLSLLEEAAASWAAAA
jgi:transcriptional regulator with XRE-family HTH domain